MNPTVSKQDVQNMINVCQNRLLERIASRQDIHMINDAVKSLLNIHQQNQQLIRQAEYQRSQLMRRAASLEARLIQIEQEIRGYKEMLGKVASAQAQPPEIVVSMPEAQSEPRTARYVYRPA